MTWALVTEVDLETANVHLAALEAAGLLGLVEEHGQVTAYFPSRLSRLPLDGRWEQVPDRDWNAEWKAGIEPVTIGAITVTPPWIDVPGALVIEPARAFGTGHHETTAGCLAALQDAPVAGGAVLDVGTGTGILALAAKKLGAARVLGLDTDEVAVATARENARRNHLDVEVRRGSLAHAADRFDVVLANLDTQTLLALATSLAAALAPSGYLVASGVAVERSASVDGALEAAGLAVEVREGLEWATLVATCRRPLPGSILG